MSAPPDDALLEGIAADLGVHPSFVEKDWHATGVVTTVMSIRTDGITPVFAGGTSLSKGYALIERFSEDVDFRVMLNGDVGRKRRRAYREELKHAITASPCEWEIEDTQSRDESRFFCIRINYRPRQSIPDGLRPHVKLEVTMKQPVLEPHYREVSSFVARARGMQPELPETPCLSPAETAADKTSALVWRVLSRDRGSPNDDPSLVRHLYDITLLEKSGVIEYRYNDVLQRCMEEDKARSGRDFKNLSSKERAVKAITLLRQDPLYREEYDRYVRALCYGDEHSVPEFDDGLLTLERLIERW